MTIDRHPITPPPELVQQWDSECELDVDVAEHLATQAAQWGADQELEACCAWFQEFYETESWVKRDLKEFRAARRPKPPSLREQALAVINSTSPYLDETAINTIRRALEALPQ